MSPASNLSSLPQKPQWISFAREQLLIKLLMAYLIAGLFFMLLPGTLLGVWNLFTISGGHSSASAPAAWIQSHGHAQLFGWIGTFILGIGFYSTPNLRRASTFSFWEGWLTWCLWTFGVAMRWIVGMYQWEWRVLLPLSALAETAAVMIFLLASMRGHRAAPQNRPIETWAVLVIAGSVGLLMSTLLNFALCLDLAFNAEAPIVSAAADASYLVLSTRGFVVPIVWGFTAHWMPVFLGLKPLKTRALQFALAVLWLGLAAAFVTTSVLPEILLIASAFLAAGALRIFEKPVQEPKVSGVHPSFPIFVRIAYAWLFVAGGLLLWGAAADHAPGLMGAGRHALTVGFFATMVLCVAPRMLPAFLGRKGLYSPKLMLISLLVLSIGCTMRVFCQAAAYQGYLPTLWAVLPVSAMLELAALVLFVINMAGTFVQPPLLDPSGHRRPPKPA